ncbi:hypothetical protein Gotur_001183, partial [Gossypium turneri]
MLKSFSLRFIALSSLQDFL